MIYGRRQKISYTKLANKMAYANSADPDLTAPETFRSSLIKVYTVFYCTKYLKKQLHKEQNLGQKNMEYIIQNMFKIFGPFLSGVLIITNQSTGGSYPSHEKHDILVLIMCHVSLCKKIFRGLSARLA